jgi:hypothetical protein
VAGLFPAGIIRRCDYRRRSPRFDRDKRARYRTAVGDPEGGRELASIVGSLRDAGVEIGGETCARSPRGFVADASAAPLLRQSALYARMTLPPGAPTSTGFVGVALEE